MKYNFDIVHNRKQSGSVKWDMTKMLFGSDDVIPMWVADMDFPAADPIIDALKKRAEHPFYGYTFPDGKVTDAVVQRMKKKFNWEIQPEWIVFTPGVVPALNAAVRSLTHPGDEIILQQPVYYPFFPSVNLSGCKIKNNSLRLENGRYEMDLRDLVKQFSTGSGMMPSSARVKAAILCNPHNPIGRVWTKEELTRFGEIILKNDAIVISDEIHCEILYKGYTHTPFASISKDFEQNSIVCMAPSKTFNLAGLETSAIIIPNKKLREGFSKAKEGIQPSPNLFGYTALEAAFRHGDEWLEQVLDYIQGNLDFIRDYFQKHIQKIKIIEPQGTYLVWLDCRELGLNDQELKKFLAEKARVGIDDGYLFGEEGSGFIRINIACPRTILNQALERIQKAVNES